MTESFVPGSSARRSRNEQRSETEEETAPERFRFSDRQRAILAAATARILPSDETAGATETGVAAYIERALDNRWYLDARSLVCEGLDFLDELSQQENANDFLQCGAREQDEILTRAQVFPNNRARRFFHRLIELTLEGFLGDPDYGGNRNGEGWAAVGYEPREDSATSRCGGRHREKQHNL